MKLICRVDNYLYSECIMADYFDELNCRPLEEGETPDHLLQLARLLRDYGMFDLLGTDQKLAPPTSKEIINNLPSEYADGLIYIFFLIRL